MPRPSFVLCELALEGFTEANTPTGCAGAADHTGWIMQTMSITRGGLFHPSAFHTTGDAQNSISNRIYGRHFALVDLLHHTTMAGCILRFARSSPLRTTLVDEATGQAVYQIDTPIRLTGSVTRIRKLDSSTQPSNRWWEDDDDSDGSSATDEEKHHVKPKKDVKNAEEEDEVELSELPETSDEVARIYWRWFSTDKIVFRGKITTRDVFLPKCGKLRG